MIIFKNVTKVYSSDSIGIKDINLSIDKNLTILGPSGCGKTTLLRCINGLELPSKGSIKYNDFNVATNLDIIRKKIGMVFQAFHLFSNMTILENLTFASLRNHPKDQKLIENKAKELLERFNINKNPNGYCSELSGGQKQRVAICRSLMLNPEVMLFDEPTSALDIESVHDVINIINELKSQDVKIILVTHDIHFAKAISDRIIFMDHGHILEDSEAKVFFQNPVSNRAKLFLENTSYGT